MEQDDSLDRVTLAERLVRIETRLEQLIDLNKTRGEDHEGRLRALERWKYALPISAFGAVLSAAVTIFIALAIRR